MANVLASTVTQFARARFGLGIGESGNFPAGIRTVTDWFPQRERAFAIGIFNAGANVGAIITPLLVPVLVLAFDWRVARSEEHTSELQSLMRISYAVFCLKKKNYTSTKLQPSLT